MRRDILKTLKEWTNLSTRRPLILRGARQIGKSFAIREFGKSSFENLVEVNLEERKDLKDLFLSNEPNKICAALALQYNQAIIPGKTLLFIDEIQESSAALLSLRYFFEKMPELHVVCAGSLFDMVLDQKKDLPMPVGRIEYRYMFPLSFLEFLDALGEKIALQFIQNLSLSQEVPASTHQHLLKLFNQYILCGGMPAVVEAYCNSQSDLRYRKLQADIIQTYKDDFRKYRTRIDYDKLEATFTALPRFIGKDFNYSELCPNYSQITTKNILRLFQRARIIHKITATYANGLPLNSEINPRGFKYVWLDVGLFNSFSGITSQDIQRWNYDLVNAGAIAEQVVAQELLAYSDSLFDPQLFFWQRNKPGSTAEVDYVVTVGQNILPVEVKSGTTGKLVSLRMFMQEKKAKLGVRISQHAMSLYEQILSVPIYAVSRLGNLVREVLGE